jgi:hypothetical protein
MDTSHESMTGEGQCSTSRELTRCRNSRYLQYSAIPKRRGVMMMALPNDKHYPSVPSPHTRDSERLRTSALQAGCGRLITSSHISGGGWGINS